MSKRRVGLHEVAYERLAEAEKRKPHAPAEMRSGQSRGPVKMWVCGEFRCTEVRYTYGTSLVPPTCFGGMQWSFTTAAGYIRGIHKPHLQWEG